MIVGFTGTQRGMSPEQHATVARVLSLLARAGQPLEFHHGGCVGADVQAAVIARTLGYRTIRHPSNIPGKQGEFDDDEVREPLDPLRRNLLIVRAAEVMIATPQGEERVRSGTWSTIRKARKEGVGLYMIERDGGEVWTPGSIPSLL